MPAPDAQTPGPAEPQRPYPEQPPAGAPASGQPYAAYPPYGYPAYPAPAPSTYTHPPVASPHGFVPPASPVVPAPPGPPVGSGPPPGYPAAPGQPIAPVPTRRSGRAWMWWLVGIAVVLVVFGCMFASLASIGGNSTVPLEGGNTIAVIPMTGTIAGAGAAPAVITPEDFLKLLQRAEDDSNVRAIVLRVDSPGGTVAASEEISTYVKQEKKPVVVSVSDVDASGAYMISSQADKIVANPGSAVGSIGVIMEIPNASGLLEKLGVSFKVITAGKYKDAGSPYRSLTASETALLQGQVDQVYGQFIDIVASGRHMPRASVEKLATGWAWNAVEAKQLGLVDQIGTYQDALKVAAKLGGIKGEYQTDVYNNDQLSGILGSLLGIESQLQKIAASSPVNPASLGSTTLAK